MVAIAESRLRKELVLFDLDGVILDSRANMEQAWAAVQAELGVTKPFAAYFSEIGRPFGDIMVRMGLADQAERIERVYRSASSRGLVETPLFDGIEDLMRRASDSGSKLGIVTSKDSARTQLVIDRLPAKFAIVMTPNDKMRGKPAPDPLLFAMAMCRVDPADTIFIGDMDSDAEAARRAGVDYAHVAWGYGSAPDACALIATSPLHLQRQLFG